MINAAFVHECKPCAKRVGGPRRRTERMSECNGRPPTACGRPSSSFLLCHHCHFSGHRA